MGGTVRAFFALLPAASLGAILIGCSGGATGSSVAPQSAPLSDTGAASASAVGVVERSATTVAKGDTTADSVLNAPARAVLRGTHEGNGPSALAIAGTPSVSVAAGATYSFQPSVTGAVGGSLSFTISNKPRWTTFSSVTGVLTGIPGTADIATNSQIVITVTDGVTSQSLAAFSIAVTASVSSFTLSWTAPTSNTNNTPITDLAGYHIYYGTTPKSLNTVVTVSGSATSQLMTGFTSGTWYFAVTAYNAEKIESAQSAVLAVELSGGTTGSNPPDVSVDLSRVAKIYATAPGGTPTRGNGIDGADGGNAYPASLLGNSQTWSGTVFNMAGSPDAASSVVINLPAGNYSSLEFLATGVNGDQRNQKFIVTYTDGTSSTITQSLSDWFTPQSFAGESVAMALPYRVRQDGSLDHHTFNLYAYSFAIDDAKEVARLTLPKNIDVVVLAVTLVP